MRVGFLLFPLLFSQPGVAGRDAMEVGTEVEKDHYSISVRRGSAGVAEKGEVTIRLYANDGYTLDNPHEIVVTTRPPPKNVQWGQSRFTREDGKLEDGGGTYVMKVPFRASRIGEYPVKGRVRFKVCKAGKCKRVSRSWKTAVVAH
jgi:hypothetical protein